MHTASLVLAGVLLVPLGAAAAEAADARPPAPAPSSVSLRKDPTRGNADFSKLDPTLQAMAVLIGGVWTADTTFGDGPARVEVRYEWALNKRAIRSKVVMGKGRADAVEAEAMFGWDPVNKNVYYIDFHGASNVFRGTIKAEGRTLVAEFSRMVGPPARWRSKDEFKDDDTLVFTVYDADKAKPEKVVGLTMHREW